MKDLKNVSGSLPWLIPGIGFQGGDLKDSINIGSLNNSISLVNISRGILYAGNGSINDIREATQIYTDKIRSFL